NVELRHGRAAGAVSFVFSIAGRIEHDVVGPDSGDAQRRLRRVKSGPAVLPNEHGVRCETMGDAVCISVTDFGFALSSGAQLQKITEILPVSALATEDGSNG